MTAAHRQLPTLALAAALAVLALHALAAPALAQDDPTRPAKPTPGVERLWKEYPLNPARRDGVTPPAAPAESPPAASEPASADGDATVDGAVVFGLVALATIAAFALSLLVLHGRPAVVANTGVRFAGRGPSARRRGPARQRGRLPDVLREGGAQMSHLVRRLLGPRGAEGRKGAATSSTGDSPDAPRAELLAAYSLRPRSDVMSNQPDERGPVARNESERGEVEPSEPVNGQDLTHVGEQVTAVLASAQHAADEIIAAAREDAARIRSQAEASVEATQAEAASEASRAREESDRLRRDAGEYSESTRAAADEYATKARASADEDAARALAEASERAKAVQTEAEQRVSELERRELRRQEALVRDAEQFEQRLDSLLEVFRGMTGQLEDVIRANREAKLREAPAEAGTASKEGSGDATEVQSDGEPLDEALRPEHARRAGTAAGDSARARARRR